jgi:hypothetical protein
MSLCYNAASRLPMTKAPGFFRSCRNSFSGAFTLASEDEKAGVLAA